MIHISFGGPISYKGRSENQFQNICTYFGVEKWEKNNKGGLVKKHLSDGRLLKELITFDC
jgi:hypothetical protein